MKSNDLPDGISMSAAGIISGTPTTAGAAGKATVTVTDSASTTDSITINYGAFSADPVITYYSGYEFKEWQEISGGANLADLYAAVTTFVMPADNVNKQLCQRSSKQTGHAGSNQRQAG